MWSTGNHQAFEWAARTEMTEVEGGVHTLYVHGREDGTKLRSIRFSQGGCGFIPQANRLPTVEPASVGVMSGSFQMAEDFVWTPPAAPNDASSDCLTEHPTTDNLQWAQMSAPQQAAATSLGWESTSWDCDFFPSHTANGAGGNDECDIPVSEDLDWQELTAELAMRGALC